jgi:hypothetical protein
MANYIDKNEYHDEMVKCKLENKLSDKIISMFLLHAKETSRLFRFESKEDREDAIYFAIKDFINYWKNFKHLSVLKIFLERNFIENEEIEIHIENLKESFKFTAKEKPVIYTQFKIGETENKTLDFLKEKIDQRMSNYLQVSLHKVTKKINLMDIHNQDPKSKSYIRINCFENLFKEQNKVQNNLIYFGEPSDAFKFNTSIIRNGMIKYFNEHHPKETRQGKKILFSRINNENNGAFNI